MVIINAIENQVYESPIVLGVKIEKTLNCSVGNLCKQPCLHN